MASGRKGKDYVNELSPAEKLAITEYTLTKNASQAIEKAFPGRYPDTKNAVWAMQNLLRKDIAKEFQLTVLKEVEQKTNISKEWMVEEIIKLKEQSSSNMDFSSSVKCLFLLAKMLGYLNHKQVIDVRKSININYGGGFNPNQYTEIDGVIVENKQLPESITFSEEQRIIIENKNEQDNSKLDEF